MQGLWSQTLRPPAREALRRVQWVCAWGLLLASAAARGAGLEDAQKLYNAGKYAECSAVCQAVLAPPATTRAATAPDLAPEIVPPAPPVPSVDGWWLLLTQAQMAQGKYDAANKWAAAGLQANPENLPLALVCREALLMAGQEDEAKALQAKVQEMATTAPWHFEMPDDRVALGQFMLLHGMDARQALETYFDKARKDDPTCLAALLATGNLALEKNDPGVAAESFAAAQKIAPDDPDVYLGLARANEDDADTATAAAAKALELNPNHVETLLLLADHLIDRERYQDAEEALAKVLAVNPKEPRAWAYRAVMAHLRGDHPAENTDRETALATWKHNPEVDYLIGQKLSQKYRFDVGNSYQKRALAFDANYEPAQFQLGQDLLRTGHEEEGWKLAETVFKADPYNIMAFNLVTLHDRLAKFTTLSNEHFLLRMDPKEAPVYGTRAMALLNRARETLCAKYDVKLDEPTTVEIFPLQQDFEIRTFGWPGEEGFLGVCFGRVLTINSPASRLSHPISWEAVAWHEFCHTVTLTKTHNKMPRWISEGISVYEERQANPAWGDHMLPAYRELILKGGAAKIGELSQGFSAPPSPMLLEFAYFEASMVVDYIVQRYGIDALRGVLTDLGNDVLINDALAKHTEPMDKLELDFAAWFRQQADTLAPKVNWEEPKLLPEDGSAPLTAWNKEHPDSFWGLVYEGEALMVERKFAEAKAVLVKARELFPNYAEVDGPYLLIAKADQELKQNADEQRVLEAFCKINADALPPRMRLMELRAADKDWPAVQKYAQQVLGVDPLGPVPYRYLADATTALGDRTTAIEARRTLLLMDPLDKPLQHYQLAALLFDDGQLPAARREADLALEDAPRYRDALALLLKIADKMDVPAATTPATAPAGAASAPAGRGADNRGPQP